MCWINTASWSLCNQTGVAYWQVSPDQLPFRTQRQSWVPWPSLASEKGQAQDSQLQTQNAQSLAHRLSREISAPSFHTTGNKLYTMSLFSLLYKSRQSPSRKRAQSREELGEIPGNNWSQSQSRTGQCGNHAKTFWTIPERIISFYSFHSITQPWNPDTERPAQKKKKVRTQSWQVKGQMFTTREVICPQR